MRIIHCCLSNFYIDNHNYQENVLPRVHRELGNEVRVIASTEIFENNLNISYTRPHRYTASDGVEIVRLPYKKYLPQKLIRKVRDYKGLYEEIAFFDPDVILFHGIQAKALLEVSQYVKNNPKVRLFADVHSDYSNSAKGWISRNILHKLYYKSIIRKSLPYIERVLCVGTGCQTFVQEMYHIPPENIEYYPLGGIIPDKISIEKAESNVRNRHNLTSKEWIFVHSGKLDKLKRTKEIISAFSKVRELNAKLFIIGSIPSDTEKEILEGIKADSRIEFLGWKNVEELMEYLMACDLYIQLGSQSATMQNAACCNCAIAVYPLENYKFLMEDAAFYIKTEEDLVSVLENINRDSSILQEYKKRAFEIAKMKLDYEVLAKQLY